MVAVAVLTQEGKQEVGNEVNAVSAAISHDVQHNKSLNKYTPSEPHISAVKTRRGMATTSGYVRLNIGGVSASLNYSYIKESSET